MRYETFLQETPNNNRLLKSSEIAAKLNISKALAYRLCQTGELPSIRISNCVRGWKF